MKFCKNTETNETVTADRGTQSAPVAPVVDDETSEGERRTNGNVLAQLLGRPDLIDPDPKTTVFQDELTKIPRYLPDSECKKNCYTCASSKGACEYIRYKNGCPRGFNRSGVARRGGAPSAIPEKGKEV